MTTHRSTEGAVQKSFKRDQTLRLFHNFSANSWRATAVLISFAPPGLNDIVAPYPRVRFAHPGLFSAAPAVAGHLRHSLPRRGRRE